MMSVAVFIVFLRAVLSLKNLAAHIPTGFIVPAGSVVVLSSASHLAWVGAAAYAQEYAAVRGRLRAAFRKGIEVVHGVPLLVGGVQNVAAIWALSDINAWLEKVNSNNSRDIQGTRKKFFEVLMGAGSPLVPENSEGGPALPPSNTQSVSPSAAARYNLYLPASLDNRDMMVMEMVHTSGGNLLPPVTYQECCNLIDSLISELNGIPD
jgi:hypothetical protein